MGPPFSWFLGNSGIHHRTKLGCRNPTTEGDPWLFMWDIIFRDSNIQPVSPMDLNLPTSHFFGTTDTGPALEQTSHKAHQKALVLSPRGLPGKILRQTLVFYKHSPYATIHYYRDAGSFQIHKNGWLAIDSGQYTECNPGTSQHSAYYTRTTAAKNSLIIYDPNEIWNGGKYIDSFHVAGNSGGQRDEYQGTTAGLLQVQSDPKQFYGGIRITASGKKIHLYRLRFNQGLSEHSIPRPG